jgi:alkylation response protein AidB-like acyl-CoA dehydrogenase
MTGSVESQELDEIRSLARDFALAELRPHVEQWDHERSTGDALNTHLAALGFFGISIPERFGGMELPLPSVVAIIDELAAGEASVALMLSMHARAAKLILDHGTDAQRAAWLERMSTGDALACIAIAEENAGSDIASIAATAKRTKDGFVINGEKRWVSNGSNATFALVLAKVDGGEAGIFLVEMNNPGVSVGAREDTLGLRPLPINTVTFKDCLVGADALLGGADADARANAGTDAGANAGANGAAQLEATASFDRLTIAAIATGIARAALEHAIGYANIREQFGQPLRTFEGIQFKLADMATCTAAASALLRQAAQSDDAQQTLMAKLFATTTAMEVTTQAVQIYGGYGYMRDYPVEKLMRDAKGMEILGGANELLRVAVAEALY